MTDSPDVLARAFALYDRYTHEQQDRRTFFAEMTKLAGGAAAANALIIAIAADPAAATIVPPDDQRLTTRRTSWPGAGGHRLSGYLARPAQTAGKLGAVVVVHENRGLNAYVEDVARRVALAGFVALAPDFLSPAGGTPADEDKARAMIGALDLPATVADGVATIRWLKADKTGNGKVGVVGFCWGGAMANRLAVAGNPDAAVAFYGPAPDPSEASRVKAPILLHYAGNDARVNASADPWVKALEAAKVPVSRFDYPGVEHAFHNDTSAARYNAAAADLAWKRTIAFFDKTLH